MHYYKFNIADWNLGTSHLSLVEEAIYFRLINFYYDSESPIPLETKPVFRRLRIGLDSDIASAILDEFFTKTDKGFIHVRCDEILKDYRKTLKNNRANGAKGGRPRADKACSETEEKPNGLISVTEEKPKHNPNQEPLTTNQEPITKVKEKPTGKPLVTFKTWLASLKDSGQSPVPETDSIFDYADDAGIPSDYLRITWLEFKAEFLEKDKRQRDWRAHFRNFVRKNYYQLWWIDNGDYKLTTRGQQAMAAMNNKKGDQQ